MKYNIIVEGHEGAYSTPETLLGTVEADSPLLAIAKYAESDSKIRWCDGWNRYVYGAVAKVLAKEVE